MKVGVVIALIVASISCVIASNTVDDVVSEDTVYDDIVPESMFEEVVPGSPADVVLEQDQAKARWGWMNNILPFDDHPYGYGSPPPPPKPAGSGAKKPPAPKAAGSGKTKEELVQWGWMNNILPFDDHPYGYGSPPPPPKPTGSAKPPAPKPAGSGKGSEEMMLVETDAKWGWMNNILPFDDHPYGYGSPSPPAPKGSGAGKPAGSAKGKEELSDQEMMLLEIQQEKSQMEKAQAEFDALPEEKKTALMHKLMTVTGLKQ